MLFNLSNLNWQEIFSECGLGRIISINKIETIPHENTSIDTYGIHNKSVVIKSRNKQNAKIETYTFNIFGLTNATIKNTKILKNDDEFMMLSEFDKAQEITTAFMDMLVLVNGNEAYLLQREYHEQSWYYTENELENMKKLEKQIKKTDAPLSEKMDALKEVEDHIKRMRKAQTISNEILTHLEHINEAVKRKEEKPINIRFFEEKEMIS